MDLDLLFLIGLGYPVMIFVGVGLHKYAISQAEKIKAHVTAEVQEVRADVAELVKKLAGRI